MSGGFIFNKDKCVNCKACSAACILENGWNISGRQVFSYNSEAYPLLPITNLSLACNHCETAVCMTGCPSSAYTRDQITGAVILDESKCTGCKYCQWNCPYDAPKFDSDSGTIVKCNQCYTEVLSGSQPACTLACPTGALSFGELSASQNEYSIPWFPDRWLKPAIELTAGKSEKPLKIVPLRNLPGRPVSEKYRKNIAQDTSLIIFTFLSTLLVSAMSTSFFNGVFPNLFVFLSVLLLAALTSMFHLGRKQRFWRALINVKRSALSREIAGFVVFSCISILTLVVQEPFMIIISSAAGLLFLLLIDNVYIFSDKRKTVIFHSGQTFLSALTIISFLSGAVFPFIFMLIIKLALSFPAFKNPKEGKLFNLRFVRIAFLILPGFSILMQSETPDYLVTIILLLGELIDRILFYFDFNPVNIRNLMLEQLNFENDEKKRS